MQIWNDFDLIIYGGLIAFLLIILIATNRSKKVKRGKSSRIHKLGEDEEKAVMGSRIVELETTNSDLRERLRNLEMEYLEKQENVKGNEAEIQRKTAELDDGLKEVYALKEMIEEYRLRVGKLSKEKTDLESKVGDLSAKLKEGNKRFDDKMQSEMKKFEEEKDDVKRKAKELVVSYKKETEDKFKALQKENKELKDKIAKLKEQYSAWEAIEGL